MTEKKHGAKEGGGGRHKIKIVSGGGAGQKIARRGGSYDRRKTARKIIRGGLA